MAEKVGASVEPVTFIWSTDKGALASPSSSDTEMAKLNLLQLQRLRAASLLKSLPDTSRFICRCYRQGEFQVTSWVRGHSSWLMMMCLRFSYWLQRCIMAEGRGLDP